MTISVFTLYSDGTDNSVMVLNYVHLKITKHMEDATAEQCNCLWASPSDHLVPPFTLVSALVWVEMLLTCRTWRVWFRYPKNGPVPFWVTLLSFQLPAEDMSLKLSWVTSTTLVGIAHNLRSLKWQQSTTCEPLTEASIVPATVQYIYVSTHPKSTNQHCWVTVIPHFLYR